MFCGSRGRRLLISDLHKRTAEKQSAGSVAISVNTVPVEEWRHTLSSVSSTAMLTTGHQATVKR